MDVLEIAAVKDNILKYLSYHPDNAIDLDTIKKDLKFYGMPAGIIMACVQEMHNDGVLIGHFVEGDNSFLVKSDKGEKFLIEGGYLKPLQEMLNEKKQQEEDRQKAREKTDLEIKNLKRTRWLSIAAFILSFLAILVALFKDLVLRLFNLN